MKFLLAGIVFFVVVSPYSGADTFGTGANQFTIDFVTISGSTNPTSGISAGNGFTFTGVANDYRIGVYEVTNAQIGKFKSELGISVTGNPSSAYGNSPYWTGTNVASNQISWYEAAQFVNWLNTSKGYQAAYNFTGVQGTSDYTLALWDTSEAWEGTNLYRHKNAFYFLPTENEWVKAAYWNGTTVQTYATKPGEILHQGDRTGTGWNYVYDGKYATDPYGIWDVGSGSEELNGTYDMMGNVLEWLESPHAGNYENPAYRRLRGGAYSYSPASLASSDRRACPIDYTDYNIGFRVASVLGVSSYSEADTFGTGANRFTIDFVTISKNTNPTSGYGIVNNNYRMGTYEITNDQWDKFKAAYGAVMGSPTTAYNSNRYWTGSSVPTNNVSWYEAAQFVNWLNTSKGFQAAYNFTGTIHTNNYTFALWGAGDADGTNLYRNKNAQYFLPTEDEWVKAAGWNGTTLQTWATINNTRPVDGVDSRSVSSSVAPWNVGSGSKEINGTYDMMYNVFEWTENPWMYGDYSVGIENDSDRCIRGDGSFGWLRYPPDLEYYDIGFRVASKPYCSEPILGDLNNDCKVDMADLAILVSSWLRCNIEPQTACWE